MSALCFENRLLDLFNRDEIDINRCLQQMNESGKFGNMTEDYQVFLNLDRDLSNVEYVRRIRCLLISWGMNRNEKLAPASVMHRVLNVDNVRGLLNQLENRTIYDIDDEILNIIHQLFNALCCGENRDCLTASNDKLVTFSKTMHFLFPNLFAPIDREYILKFFRNSKYVPANLDRQFGLFKQIHIYYKDFARDNRNVLENIERSGFNQTIPKIIDNIVIGFMLG